MKTFRNIELKTDLDGNWTAIIHDPGSLTTYYRGMGKTLLEALIDLREHIEVSATAYEESSKRRIESFDNLWDMVDDLTKELFPAAKEAPDLSAGGDTEVARSPDSPE